jgi:antitoxin component YwqK of YwqJK toxin-antitoxin module
LYDIPCLACFSKRIVSEKYLSFFLYYAYFLSLNYPVSNRVLLLIFFFLVAVKVSGQPYKYVYYLDNDLNFASKEQYSIIGKGYGENGLFKLDCFSKFSGIMLVSATFRDSTLAVLHGPFRTYYADAKIESGGDYADNELDGVWQKWNKEGMLTDSSIYRKGIKMVYAQYSYYYHRTPYVNPSADTLRKAGYEVRYTFTDSLNNIFTEKQFTISGPEESLLFEANFKGERGLVSDYDKTGKLTRSDSVFTRKVIEAEFPGGDAGWRSFLQGNLKGDVPVDNNAGPGTYTVIVRFIINSDGSLDEIEAENDPGFGMAGEAIRVLKKSPKWKPAVLYGRNRRVIRRQPISFQVDVIRN